MADLREQSISPMTRSPRGPSPSTRSDGQSERPKDTNRILSRLRIGQSTNDAATHPTTVQGAQDGHPIMSKSPATSEPDEFPFASTPPPEVAPTNELFNSEQIGKLPLQVPHANGAASTSAVPPVTYIAPVSRRPTGEGDESDGAPKGRRSVHFNRSATFGTDPASHSRNESWEADETDGKGKEREKHGTSLMTKLKALAAPIAMPGHSRSHSAYAGAGPTHNERNTTYDALSPAAERDEFRFDGDDSEADADAEESAGEGPSRPPRRRRKSRRWFNDDGTQTAPTTPKNTKEGRFFSGDSPHLTPTSTQHRPTFLRRGTMSDIPEAQRQGMSEDEGRDRMAKESAWRRGLHSARGMSYAGLRGHDHGGEESEPSERRPSQLRRLTGFGATPDGQPSPWKMRSERTSSLSAQKWRSIKSTLKMLGNTKKAERQVADAKSAELMAELLAGAPAALFLASMFQRDENDARRIPVLLEQLKISITDSYSPSGEKDKALDRHTNFRIELEYGSGLTRMKWVVHRSLFDFWKLHSKYKYMLQKESLPFGSSSKKPSSKKSKKEFEKNLAKQALEDEDDGTIATTKGPKLPAYPQNMVPIFHNLRRFKSDDEEEKAQDDGVPDGGASAPEGPSRFARAKSSFYLSRRKSSIGSPDPTTGAGGTLSTRHNSSTNAIGQLSGVKVSAAEKHRKSLETYLHQMVAFLIFRPDSNRLCKFLELSALGVRLAAEGGYHGKEGKMTIMSTKGVDNRSKWGAKSAINKHSPKWFLVRESYVVCVDGPEAMHLYDVFLIDSDFNMESSTNRDHGKKTRKLASEAKATATRHHYLRLYSSERKIKVLPKSERQGMQFEESIKFMAANTQWAKPQRFGSFAPVRKNCYAQFLVDGRDYMWNVSRAINMAKDVIYIHDWWLSPELYMRRPAAISQKWRLDRLLQRKAQEGVKIFVIVYRNINTAVPIDSEYTKFSLLDLHPNVFVQRSPNQIRQNTFFWAHHEKICIVDHTVAFCGGVDLCFGRWDTAQHTVTDDKLTGFELDDNPKDAEHCQLWPGKDYSNPRVQDFYNLDKPYEEMYDRTKIPRMPWHDIGMQVVGQPARDLTRHFVQRWNYLLRQRKPSRPTPLLLPPPDFNPADIEALGLDGTCEVQILRSATSWSLGTPNKTEHSIMNAYVQMISTSEHFVYIENQFFISSCEVMGTRVENRIGDALVDRIKRAHNDQEDWRACIVIPLMPGFQNTVDQQEGSSVRLIMTCQYRSICRGETSIFGRLRAAGIEPEDYIQFYALRSWGELGPQKSLVTEQLYIHAKCMIVDDRVAIIGSANINERSMLGSRDSEVAAVVRDTEMLDSYMAGEPYKVGKFPHMLRMRLMREHLGLDVDGIAHEEEGNQSDLDSAHFHTESSRPSSDDADRITEQKLADNRHRANEDLIARAEKLHSFNGDIDWEQEDNPNLLVNKKTTADARVQNNTAHDKDVRGEGVDLMSEIERGRPSVARGRDSYINEEGREVLVSDVAPEPVTVMTPKKSSSRQGRGRSNTTTTRASGQTHLSLPEGYAGLPPPRLPRMDTHALGLTQLSQLPSLPVLDDTDIGGPPLQRTFSGTSSNILHPLLAEMRRPVVTDDCMKDPINDAFYLDTWHTVAENNTKLFRQVFRCQPDNEVKTWKEYKEYAAFAERFSQAQGSGKSTMRKEQETPGRTGPPGTGTVGERIASMAGGASKTAGALGEKLAGGMGLGDHGEKELGQGKVENWAKDQESRVNSPTVEDEKASFGLMADDAVVSPVDGRRPPGETFIFPPVEKEKSHELGPGVGHGTATLDFASAHANQNLASGTTLNPSPHPSGSSELSRPRTVTISEPQGLDHPSTTRTHGNTFTSTSSNNNSNNANHNTYTTGGSRKGRRRGATKSSTRAFHSADENVLLSKEDARNLVGLVQGHLVVWPYEWLEKEEEGGGWLYTVDQIAPLEIYT